MGRTVRTLDERIQRPDVPPPRDKPRPYVIRRSPAVAVAPRCAHPRVSLCRPPVARGRRCPPLCPPVRQDSLNHGALREDGDESHPSLAPRAREDVPPPYAVQQRGPVHPPRALISRRRFGGGRHLHPRVVRRPPRLRRGRSLLRHAADSTDGRGRPGARAAPILPRWRRDHRDPPRRIRCKYTMVPNQRKSPRGHWCGQPRHEFHRFHDPVRLSAPTGHLQQPRDAPVREFAHPP